MNKRLLAWIVGTGIVLAAVVIVFIIVGDDNPDAGSIAGFRTTFVVESDDGNEVRLYTSSGKCPLPFSRVDDHECIEATGVHRATLVAEMVANATQDYLVNNPIVGGIEKHRIGTGTTITVVVTIH